jgi:hypothetical protein
MFPDSSKCSDRAAAGSRSGISTTSMPAAGGSLRQLVAEYEGVL